jgi:integrase
MANNNHPLKGSSTRTLPFSLKDIRNLKLLLRDKPRDYALLVCGVNLALRGGELLSLRIGQVRHLQPGDTLYVYQQKTKKQRQLVMNKASVEAIQRLLGSMKGGIDDSAYLFRSRKGGGRLCIQHLCHLVKSWAEKLNLRGNYGSHSLRRSFGAIQRLEHGVSVEVLAKCYGHSSPAVTMRYIGLCQDEVNTVFMRDI